MRKLMILMATLGLLFTGVGVASANATSGYHNNTFYSCTNDGRQATVYVRYEIWNTGFRLDEVEYSTSPNFLANAFAVYLETDPGVWTKVSPSSYPYGNGSSTLDDVPSYFHVYYVGDVFDVFANHDNPKLQVRFYGVGQGPSQHNCTSSYELE